jgi:hypothetical protein
MVALCLLLHRVDAKPMPADVEGAQEEKTADEKKEDQFPVPAANPFPLPASQVFLLKKLNKIRLSFLINNKLAKKSENS